MSHRKYLFKYISFVDIRKLLNISNCILYIHLLTQQETIKKYNCMSLDVNYYFYYYSRQEKKKLFYKFV